MQQAAARKARNGCLKGAAQLHVTQAAFPKARQQAQQTPHTTSSKRTLARCIRGFGLGAEPGPSGWRNGLWIDLQHLEDGLNTALAWVDLWTSGNVTKPIATLWQRSNNNSLPKPKKEESDPSLSRKAAQGSWNQPCVNSGTRSSNELRAFPQEDLPTRSRHFRT